MRISHMAGSALGVFIFLMSGVKASENIVVQTDAGRVRGVIEGDVLAYRGIPYAASPVGALRWRPPQPIAHWQGIRESRDFQHDCLQEPFPGDMAPSRVAFSEDCLYLNVWKPIDRLKSHPVMVWIHGGGFVNGGSSPLIYDGSEFAKSGVVLVNFNYRLGQFGFFAHPALSAEQPDAVQGNYGLMDQMKALQWVKSNIGAFGGDVNNITVFGESAGGASIHYLMASPLTKDLFNKAIIESGAGRASPFGSRKMRDSADSAESYGMRLALRFGIDGVDASALQRLRNIPGADLAKGLNMATMGRDTSYVGGPVLDGKFIVGDPASLYEKGIGPRIPVIVGATNRDLGFILGNTAEELLSRFGPDETAARATFDPRGVNSVEELRALIGGDQFMIEPARHVARILSARGQPVYEFRFSYVPESLRATVPGATHASELPYVFDTVKPWMHGAATESDIKTAQVVHDYWVAFAKSGVPKVTGRPAWPSYHADTDQIIDFTNQGPISGADLWRARLDLTERASARP